MNNRGSIIDIYSSSADDVEEVDFVIKDLQYSSVLGIPPLVKLLHMLYAYFAKINASTSIPSWLGWIYYILITVQIFIPSFFPDCVDIWPRDNFLSLILSIISYFYQGPSFVIRSARVEVSFSLAVLFIVATLIMISRAYVYQKTGRIANIEAKLMLSVFKFVMPFLTPLLASGIPISFYQILVEGNVGFNVVTIVISLLTLFVFYFILIVVVFQRVLLEDIPTHEWVPLLIFYITLHTTVLSIVTGVAGCINGISRIGCSIYMLLAQLALGFYIFHSNTFVKSIISVISSSFVFTTAFTSLVITIDICLSKPLSPEIIFFVSIIFFVIILILLKILKQKEIIKIMGLMDSLIEDQMDSRGKIAEYFKYPSVFLGKVRPVIELWHPYIMTFELFDFAVTQWPSNIEVLILYSRILSFFPSKNSQMMWIASLISKQPHSTFFTSYLLQYRHLSRTRQRNLTSAIKKQIDEINSKKEILMILLRRFWENILQKDRTNFWDEAEKIHRHIADLDFMMVQLLDDYPNNPDVLCLYFDYTEHIKHDHIEARETFNKIKVFQNVGTIKSDLALDLAVHIFPNFRTYIQTIDISNAAEALNVDENNFDNIFPNHHESSDNKKKAFLDNQKDDSSDGNDDKLRQSDNIRKCIEKYSNSSNSQIEYALNQLTNSSKLGGIWFGCIIVSLMAIVSIILFYCLLNSYSGGLINQQSKALDFLEEIQTVAYDITYLSFEINALPLTFDADSPIFDLTPDNFISNIAPVLFQSGRLSSLNISVGSIAERLTAAKTRFSSMINALSQLDIGNSFVQQINYLLSEHLTYVGRTTSDVINQLLLYCQDITACTDTNCFYFKDDLFIQFKVYYYVAYYMLSDMAALANQYSSSSFDNNLDIISYRAVFVVMITILFITVPYIIQLYILYIQSNEIAESFTYFPNTEIRDVINKFDNTYPTSSKIEGGSPNISSLNHLTNSKIINQIKLMVTFFSSFLVLTICALVVYYTSKEFSKNAAHVSQVIYSLYPPFTSLHLSFTKQMRLYMMVINESYYNPYFDTLDSVYLEALDMINSTIDLISSGLWGENGGVIAFYQDRGKSFDYFEDIFSSLENQVPLEKSYFERIATTNFPDSIDIILQYISSYVEKYDIFSQRRDHPLVGGLLYYFMDFGENNRIQVYINLVKKYVRSELDNYQNRGELCFYIVIVWQILSCLMMIIYMVERHNRIKRTLRFYHFLNPNALMQNKNAIMLIETGKFLSDTGNKTSFSNADQIISHIIQGVVIVQRNLTVIDFNPAFSHIVEIDDEQIVGSALNKMISKYEDDKSLPNLIQHISEALLGKYPPKFSENINGVLLNGHVVHFHCNVICLTGHRAACEGEHDDIEKIAIVFDDFSDNYMRQKTIEKEQENLTYLLSSVIPVQKVHEFQENGDSLAFVIQNVIIGHIEIVKPKKFNSASTEYIVFNENIFKLFDQEINNFNTLCKYRTFKNIYSFAGGIFNTVSRPDFHAEEAIHFSLKLIQLISSLEDNFETKFHLKVGIHSGGPVVAGAIGLSKPVFQIIGSVGDLANQMRITGHIDQVHITRQVYEHVFSAGFHIQERGEIMIRRGEKILSYEVKSI